MQIMTLPNVLLLRPVSRCRNRWRLSTNVCMTRMWANAQRDGRPAEYRRGPDCPLFNAAKFGWRPLLECRALTLPRRETRWNLLGCPNCRTDLSRQWAEIHYSLATCGGDIAVQQVFVRLSISALVVKNPTNLCEGAQMAIVGVIFVSCFSSESCAAHFRPAF